MKNLSSLIGHTILATDENSQFFVSMQGEASKVACFELWCAENNHITHIQTKWVNLITPKCAQEVAELWLCEHIEDASTNALDTIPSILAEKIPILKKFKRKITPLPHQLGQLTTNTNELNDFAIDLVAKVNSTPVVEIITDPFSNFNSELK